MLISAIRLTWWWNHWSGQIWCQPMIVALFCVKLQQMWIRSRKRMNSEMSTHAMMPMTTMMMMLCFKTDPSEQYSSFFSSFFMENTFACCEMRSCFCLTTHQSCAVCCAVFLERNNHTWNNKVCSKWEWVSCAWLENQNKNSERLVKRLWLRFHTVYRGNPKVSCQCSNSSLSLSLLLVVVFSGQFCLDIMTFVVSLFFVNTHDNSGVLISIFLWFLFLFGRCWCFIEAKIMMNLCLCVC